MQTKLTLTEKRYILECIVLNYDCFLSIFYENAGGKAAVDKRLEKAETEKDIRKIVNEYI